MMKNTIEDRNDWMVVFINNYYINTEAPLMLVHGTLCHEYDAVDVIEKKPIQDVMSSTLCLRSVMGNRVAFTLICRDLTISDGDSYRFRRYILNGTMKWMVDHSAKDQPMFTVLEKALRNEHLETITDDDIKHFLSLNDGQFVFAVEDIVIEH